MVGWLVTRKSEEPLRRLSTHFLLCSLSSAVLPHILKALIDQERPDRLTVSGHWRGVPVAPGVHDESNLVLTVLMCGRSNVRSASVSRKCWSRTHWSQPTQAGLRVALNRRNKEGIVGLAKRPWTDEDNARLKEFVAQDASIIRAAAAFNRSITNVRIQAPFPPMRVFRKKLADAPWRRY